MPIRFIQNIEFFDIFFRAVTRLFAKLSNLQAFGGNACTCASFVGIRQPTTNELVNHSVSLQSLPQQYSS